MSTFQFSNKLRIFLSEIIILLLLTITTSSFTPGIAYASDLSQPPIQVSMPYIIVFKDTVNPRTVVPEIAKAYGLQTGFIYEHALKGMSALVPAGRLIALQNDPRVAYVVEDLERNISAQETPTGIKRIFANTNSQIDIDSIDDYRVDVDVAVIDTGVDFQHPDLNVAGGVNCTIFKWFIVGATCEAGGDDDHYHGTHVAGTIGAIDNGEGVVGVAPGARLWAVKVLNSRGSGYSSWIVAGIDWVAANADTIEVANMSLGGAGFSQAEYDAIQGAVNAGVAFAVAAGNEDDDANNYSPGGFDNVLSVSALADFDGIPGGLGSPTCRIDQDDTLADFSNWGPEVDIAAPGVCILSTYPLEQGSYGTISGTSMASPHAAGALALLASVTNPNTAADVYNLYGQIVNAGNFNWIDDSGDGIKEPLLDVHTFDPTLIATGGTPNTPPIASFTYQVSGQTVTFTDQSTDQDGSLSGWHWDFGDGQISTEQNPSHTYIADGTFTVTLTVTDDDGASDTETRDVIVSTTPTNQSPTAAFIYNASYLSVTFTDQSTDADGTIAAWSWTFGNGATSTVQNPSHIYAASGTYTVTLTVTDDDGATSTSNQDVSVSSQTTSTITVVSLTDISYTLNKNFWKASVMVTLEPAFGGAAVSGIWGDNSTFTCTTDSTGTCSSAINVRTKIAEISLTITDVSLVGYQYNPSLTSIVAYLPQ